MVLGQSHLHLQRGKRIVESLLDESKPTHHEIASWQNAVSVRARADGVTLITIIPGTTMLTDGVAVAIGDAVRMTNGEEVYGREVARSDHVVVTIRDGAATARAGKREIAACCQTALSSERAEAAKGAGASAFIVVRRATWRVSVLSMEVAGVGLQVMTRAITLGWRHNQLLAPACPDQLKILQTASLSGYQIVCGTS